MNVARFSISILGAGLMACSASVAALPAAADRLDRPAASHYAEPTPTPAPESPTAPTAEVPPDISAPPANTQAPAPRSVPAPAPAVVRWRLAGPGLDVPIAGRVGNCGATVRPVPYGGAYVDACQPGLWFDCHIAVCPAMNGWGIGSEVTYFDGDGQAHVYHVTGIQFGAVGGTMSVSGPIHFQVCTTAAGTTARVLSAA